jgi:alpha-mannosidase
MPFDASPPDDMLTAKLEAMRDMLTSAKFGFPPQRWKVVTGGSRRAIIQTSAGHFIGLEPNPGETIILETKLVVPERVTNIPLAGDDLNFHVFSRFPFSLSCDDRDVVVLHDPPIARGRIMTSVISELSPGREHNLTIAINVPENLIAYGFQLAFSTSRLRDQWHEADACWSRVFLIAESLDDPAARDAMARELERAIPDASAMTAQSLSRSITQYLAESQARPLGPLPDVYLVGHAHVDIDWLWTWEQTKRAVKAICARAVDLLARDSNLHFSLSQSAVYDMLHTEDPALFGEIRKWVRAGRWEPVTAAWVEHDANLLATESIVRQLVLGRRSGEELLDAEPKVCLASDTFGHAATMPQLLVRSGISAYYHIRCHPLPGPYPPAYRWAGPDGSVVTGIVTDSYDGELLASRVAGAAAQARRSGLDTGLLLFDIDGHTGEDVLEGLRRLEALAGDPALPRTRCTTLQRFAEKAAQQELPTFSGVPPTIFEATYTSQAAAKQANRRAETMLQRAEALCCMAGLDRRPVLARSWRKLLLAQNHDTLAGTAIAPIYQRLAEDTPGWERAVRQVTDEAAEALAAGCEADFALINPAPWAREEWVMVHGWQAKSVISPEHGPQPVQLCGEGMGFLARVPPWSVTGYRLGPRLGELPPDGPDALRCGERLAAEVLDGEESRKDYFTMRNRFFSAVVRGDTGAIVSLVMPGGRDLVAYGTTRKTTFSNTSRPELGLNVLQIFRERPHVMSAWHLHEVFSETSLTYTGRTSWVERGPLRATLRTTHSVGDTTIVQDMTVYRDLARLDIATTVDWAEPSNQQEGAAGLKVAFTPDLPRSTVHVGAPAGVIESAGNGQESPMQRWADVCDGSYGLAVVTEDRYGYDALGPRLRVTLLRGAYDPAADADLGSHVFRYSIVPHRGTWRDAGIPVLAESLSQPVAVSLPAESAQPAPRETACRRPLPVMDPGSGAMVSAVKWADSGDAVICRVLDWRGSGVRAVLEGLPPGTQCSLASLAEEPAERVPVVNGRAEFDMGPWAMETVMLTGPGMPA